MIGAAMVEGVQPPAQVARAVIPLLMNPVDTAEGMNVLLPVRYISGGTTKD